MNALAIIPVLIIFLIWAVGVALFVYLVVLASRLVKAVERIADRIGQTNPKVEDVHFQK